MELAKRYLQLLQIYIAANPRTVTIVAIVALVLAIFLIIHLVAKRRKQKSKTSQPNSQIGYPENLV